MFAMKYMNKLACAKQEAISNVVREVDILKKVEHAFVVNLWYCFQDEEDMFMVVDLLLGGDLRFHMQEDVNFTEKHVQLYISELALALDYLQSKNILHRDIKPDNILLDEEGHVHVTDFNIATELTSSESATSMSGTKPYMGDPCDTIEDNLELTLFTEKPRSSSSSSSPAPEVFSTAVGECLGYSYPVDWWALGVTAFELLKKRRPFGIHSESNAQQTRQTIYSTKISPIPSISDEMNDLIFRLLDIDPANRIQNVQTVQSHPAMKDLDFDKVLLKTSKPLFVPSKDHLNCDPTYELEEMIIETKPLHKKKKRLAKQMSKKESMSSSETVNNATDTSEELYKAFKYYNRERPNNDDQNMNTEDKPVTDPERITRQSSYQPQAQTQSNSTRQVNSIVLKTS